METQKRRNQARTEDCIAKKMMSMKICIMVMTNGYHKDVYLIGMKIMDLMRNSRG